jgi:hypothetical protein
VDTVRFVVAAQQHPAGDRARRSGHEGSSALNTSCDRLLDAGHRAEKRLDLASQY